MSDDQVKEALKEALKEWLDSKVQQFGWWTVKTMSVLALTALVYFILWSSGWHK